MAGRRHRAQRRPARQLTRRATGLARGRGRARPARRGRVGIGGLVAYGAWRRRRPPSCPSREQCRPRRTVAPSSSTSSRRENAALIAAIVGPARDARPRGDDRPGDGVPGVQAPQPRLRRPRLARAVPAASVAGLGHPRSRSSTRSYSINAFYDALERVDGYQALQVTEAAQQVQRSGFPDAYADHEADARVLASALTGYSRAAFWCTVDDDRDEAATDLDDPG